MEVEKIDEILNLIKLAKKKFDELSDTDKDIVEDQLSKINF
jgi:hypothetical protein